MNFKNKIAKKHFEIMQSKLNRLVKNEKDVQKAKDNIETLQRQEKQWLIAHPQCTAFFDSLNGYSNPVKFVAYKSKNLSCKGCVFAAKGLCGETKSICEKYQYPNLKPDDILYNGGECKYRKEKSKSPTNCKINNYQAKNQRIAFQKNN